MPWPSSAYSTPSQSSPGYTSRRSGPSGASIVLCTGGYRGRVVPARTNTGSRSSDGVYTSSSGAPDSADGTSSPVQQATQPPAGRQTRSSRVGPGGGGSGTRSVAAAQKPLHTSQGRLAQTRPQVTT